MLIDNMIYYEQASYIEINQPASPLFYFFDYDERSYSINMQFQHFHPFYEIHILLDDYANHIIEGTPYSMSKFDIACLRPNLLHKSEYPIGEAKKRLVIQFQFPTELTGIRKELEQILEIFHAEVPIYRFSRNHQKKIFELINEIYYISRSDSGIKQLLIHTKFIEFLSAFYMCRNKSNYIPDTQSQSSNKIYSITAYIHSHFKEDLSLESLSKIFYMSTYYLSHQFKEVTGFTLTSYIQMIRIQNAQQMLLVTDKKITKIAEECGFTSFSQFNRVFNKFCGTSPREFKAKSLKNWIDRKNTPLFMNRD